MQRRVGLDVRLRDDILVPLPREEHRDAFFLVVWRRPIGEMFSPGAVHLGQKGGPGDCMVRVRRQEDLTEVLDHQDDNGHTPTPPP